LAVTRHTTFTDKVIKYFKKCNVFIVILTRNSIYNQFINQEWGYAKSLKELGQIQLIQHISEICLSQDDTINNFDVRYDEKNRIVSRGFISSNMEFIDLIYDGGHYQIGKAVNELVSFLESKAEDLKPIFTEIQLKLSRFNRELKQNSILFNDLDKNKNLFVPEDIVQSMKTEKRYEIRPEEMNRVKLSQNPNRSSVDYGLQLVAIGHFIESDFIKDVELYIQKCQELNTWKDIVKQWAICRGVFNPGNTDSYYRAIDECRAQSKLIKRKLKPIMEVYELDG